MGRKGIFGVFLPGPRSSSGGLGGIKGALGNGLGDGR